MSDGLLTPEGFVLVKGRAVEAWANVTTGELVVLGAPIFDDEDHSCDEMGCSSIGPHVLARSPALATVPNPEALPALLEACKELNDGETFGAPAKTILAYRACMEDKSDE